MNARTRLATAVLNVVEQLENRMLLSGDVWVVNGDYSRRRPNDSIIVDIDPTNFTRVRALVNGTNVGTRALAGLAGIQVNAGRGNDRVSIEMGVAGDDVAVSVFGGEGNDRILGDAGNQLIYGGAGNDYIDAAGGNDTVWGESGNDDLAGGDGNDWLDGNIGHDSLSGGWGMDRLLGEKGSDQLDGGEGRDMIAGGDSGDVIKGGSGRDAYDGEGGRDYLYVQTNNDTYLSDPMDRVRGEDGKLLMLRTGKSKLAQKIRELSLSSWESYLGTKLNYGWWQSGFLASSLNAGAPRLANSGGDSTPQTPTPDHSNTNVQEEGVDEADIVETDGNWLYSLIGNDLVVTDANQLKVAHRETLEGTPLGMYLYGDTLTILSWDYDGGPVVIDGRVQMAAGYVMPSSYREFVRVTTLDVSDPTEPSVSEQTEIDGDYVSSRAIRDRVYVVVSNAVQGIVPMILSDGKGGLQYESKASYLARLDGAIEEEMPGYNGWNDDGQVTDGSLMEDDNFYSDEQDMNWWYNPTVTVTMLDTADGVAEPVDSTTIAGYRGQIYVSGDSLYIAQSNWSVYDTSNLYKFTLGTDSVVLAAKGTFAGYVANQFSMDEEGQHLRLSAERWNNGRSTSVCVFDQVGDELRLVGSADNIAPGETLYATRFVGNRAYIVTFLQIDPLFIVDLTDPTAPAVMGELVIPGFSRYLHPIDETHLIGLGRDGADVQVSLFDVSDMANPQRVDVYTIGSRQRWSVSIAEYDHHAFSYFPETGILAFPVGINYYGSADDKTVMEVVRVNPASGFESLGEISHTGQVYRGVRIGQNLFSVGDDAIRVVKLEKPEEEVAVILL